MSEQEELATMVAKAIEIMQSVRSRMAGGKHAPAPVADRTTFRTICVSFWDVEEKPDKTGTPRVRAKIRTFENEDFYIYDAEVIKALDPQKRGEWFQVNAQPIRDAEGNPIKNKRGMGIFRVGTIEAMPKPKKDGDPNSAFDAAHEIPF